MGDTDAKNLFAKKKEELAKEKQMMEEKVESEKSKRLQLQEELCHSKLILNETTLHQQFLQNQLNVTQTELRKIHEENKSLLLTNKRLSSAVVEQGSVNKKKRQDIPSLSRQQ